MVTSTMKLKDTYSWKESYDNLDNVLKSRDITLLTVVDIVKVMVFPVVMYECWAKRRLSTEELMLSNCGI